MRIGYIFNTPVIVGGGEISFIDLIDGIRVLGVEPVVFVPGQGEVMNRIKALGIETHEIDMPRIGLFGIPALLRRQKQLSRQFRDLHLKLIHVNGARSMLYAGPAAEKARLRCIWHVRVLERDRILDKVRARYSDKIIVNSKGVAHSLGKYVPRLSDIRVIHNGIRLDEFRSAEPIDFDKEFGAGKDPVVLGVGRFTWWKGFEDLIAACRFVKDSGVKFSCLLVGEALPHEKDYEHELKTLVKNLKLEEAVHFCGWREDIARIMKSATVFVLPSREEPFGRVIVEAWSAGLPVVATNKGGPAELIESQVNGILVPPRSPDSIGRAVSMLLEDKGLRDRLVTAGLRSCENFTLARHVEQVFDLYNSLTGTGNIINIRAFAQDP